MSKPGLALLTLLAITACASGRGPASGQFGGGAGTTFDSPGPVLATAREQQAKKGCASAVPAYRVVSAYGKGFDVAQFELGACLLEMSGEEGPEAALFREEGLFWLRRAAWAGNARAQRELAGTLSGASRADIMPNPVEALGWALIYKKNSDRDLYNLPPVEASVLEHLESSLTGEETEAAKTFVRTFSHISMEAFTPPARETNPSSQPGDRPAAPKHRW